jgi:hypothetical protein
MCFFVPFLIFVSYFLHHHTAVAAAATRLLKAKPVAVVGVEGTQCKEYVKMSIKNLMRSRLETFHILGKKLLSFSCFSTLNY